MIFTPATQMRRMKSAGRMRSTNHVITPQDSPMTTICIRKPASTVISSSSANSIIPPMAATEMMPAKQSWRFAADWSSPRFSGGYLSCIHALSGARKSAAEKARKPRQKRNAQPPGCRNASVSADTVINNPASGTQPSSMRFLSSQDALPNPSTMPKPTAVMKSEESVPNPLPPSVIDFATFTDQRLMNAAKPQK